MSIMTMPSTHNAEQLVISAITAELDNIGELRDDFLDLCEDMNLDASIEAARPR